MQKKCPLRANVTSKQSIVKRKNKILFLIIRFQRFKAAIRRLFFSIPKSHCCQKRFSLVTVKTRKIEKLSAFLKILPFKVTKKVFTQSPVANNNFQPQIQPSYLSTIL